MRVGIVGTGIAGLTAGWLFERAGARVTVFEKLPSLGMDSHSVSFEIEGQEVRSDVPPRMFNASLWPNLVSLYRHAGVETEPVEPSKTFGQHGGQTILKLGDSYLPKLSTNLVFNSSARSILKDIRRMLIAAPADIDAVEITMGEYLKTGDYSTPFIYEFLFPALSSTVCTCSYESLESYPAKTLLKAMLDLTKPEGLSRTRFGTKDVVSKLIADIEDVRLSTPVACVEGQSFCAVVRTESGAELNFDHVIVATQANVAKQIVRPQTAEEFEMLDSFRYHDVSIVVHTDDSLMPSQKRDWSQFNLLSNDDQSAAMCSIWMNRFCPEWEIGTPVFQTIMPVVDPKPQSVIRESRMQRPVVDKSSVRGLQLHRNLHEQSNRHVWFCGSYASPGVPLLESGVVSSLNVANQLGIKLPGECQV